MAKDTARTIEVDGVVYNLRLTRRWGPTPGKCFVWVEAEIGGEWQVLGDPWPSAHPINREIVEHIEFLVKGPDDYARRK